MARTVQLDDTDRQILSLLSKNGRLSWNEIGQTVHLTGQAVALRVARLQDSGTLKGFTVRTDPAGMGLPITAFLDVRMKTAAHAEFLDFLRQEPAVLEAHRTSGAACYILKIGMPDMATLNEFLDRLLRHANYTLSLSIADVGP